MGTNDEPPLTRRAFNDLEDRLEELRREQAVESYEQKRALEDELELTRDQLTETVALVDRVKTIVGRPVAYINGHGPTAEEQNLMALGRATQLRFLLGIDPGDIDYRGVVVDE